MNILDNLNWDFGAGKIFEWNISICNNSLAVLFRNNASNGSMSSSEIIDANISLANDGVNNRDGDKLLIANLFAS